MVSKLGAWLGPGAAAGNSSARYQPKAAAKVPGERVGLELFLMSLSPASARCQESLAPLLQQLSPIADVTPRWV